MLIQKLNCLQFSNLNKSGFKLAKVLCLAIFSLTMLNFPLKVNAQTNQPTIPSSSPSINTAERTGVLDVKASQIWFSNFTNKNLSLCLDSEIIVNNLSPNQTQSIKLPLNGINNYRLIYRLKLIDNLNQESKDTKNLRNIFCSIENYPLLTTQVLDLNKDKFIQIKETTPGVLQVQSYNPFEDGEANLVRTGSNEFKSYLGSVFLILSVIVVFGIFFIRQKSKNFQFHSSRIFEDKKYNNG